MEAGDVLEPLQMGSIWIIDFLYNVLGLAGLTISTPGTGFWICRRVRLAAHEMD